MGFSFLVPSLLLEASFSHRGKVQEGEDGVENKVMFSQTSHRAPLNRSPHTEWRQELPSGLRYWVSTVCTPRLLLSSFCSKSPENGLLWCLFFLCKNSYNHLHLPSAPQIDPQVAGNLIGRSNLTKVSKPPCPHILTLLLSPVLLLLPRGCTTAGTCQRARQALPRLLQCFPLGVAWKAAKSSVFLI